MEDGSELDGEARLGPENFRFPYLVCVLFIISLLTALAFKAGYNSRIASLLFFLFLKVGFELFAKIHSLE